MGGLNLSAGGLGGVKNVTAPQYGSAQSYTSGLGATSAAFAGPSTVPTMSTGQLIAPKHAFGVATWLGITSIVLLVCIRRSLPN